jgi:tetratricopeptide (TPR) repeat protein
VDAVVEGSVLRAGGRLRLTVQLVDAVTDRQLWAAIYDRDVADTLRVQGELARSVAREVQVTVTEQEQALLARRRPVDPAAYDSYLRGRHFWDRRSETSLRRSIECFQEAVDRDPTLAVAWAGMALAYGPLGYWGYVPPGEARARMQAAIARALELDAGLVEAHTALAAFKAIHDWDWEGADHAWNAVLARNPGNALAHLWYGLLLESRGQAEEAITERTLALELDPLSLSINTSLGDTLSLAGQQDRAIAQYQRALELDPRYPPALRGLGWALLMKGRHTPGLAKLEEAAELSGRDTVILSWLGHSYGIEGRTTKALRVLAALEERASNRYLSPYHLAVVHAGLGQMDAAFLRLDEALRERTPVLFHARVDPLLAPLRSDPRFRHLLRGLALD